MNSTQVDVLIVEDERSLQTALSEKLTLESYRVLTASNGEEGLETALKTHPNIILLDERMPKMTGTEMLKKLRADAWGKEVPVIMLTNVDPDQKMLDVIKEAQLAYYIIKSSSQLNDVVEKVREVLNLRYLMN